jgi:medium-chain acyl-[acyl-carrier-protein] hydrolase
MYTKEYEIHVYETSPNGKLRLHSLFDFLQDIASDHAVKLGFGRDDLMKGNRMWVLSRIYAVITEWPVWEDRVSIRTWHKGTEKIFAFRDYKIFFPDGRPIAAATSSWLIIDQTTRKIQRPDVSLVQHNSDEPVPDALPRNAAKLDPAADDGWLSSRFKVRTSDLDINLHTNNVRYLQWIMDSYDLGFVMKHVPCAAEINFLAESHHDDEIVLRTSADKNSGICFNHSIMRSSDNAELCRVRVEWKESSSKA